MRPAPHHRRAEEGRAAHGESVRGSEELQARRRPVGGGARERRGHLPARVSEARRERSAGPTPSSARTTSASRGKGTREARCVPARRPIYFAFFHAASAKGKVGFFRPYIGCIPPREGEPALRLCRPGSRARRGSSIAARPCSPSRSVSRRPRRAARRVSASSAAGTRSSSAPPRRPNPSLVSKVHVVLTIANGKVLAAIQTDPGMPPSAQAELQLGAVCAK